MRIWYNVSAQPENITVVNYKLVFLNFKVTTFSLNQNKVIKKKILAEDQNANSQYIYKFI